MNPNTEHPKDGRMMRIRKTLQSIGRDLHIIRNYSQKRVPRQYQKEFQQQIQRAFEAGIAYGEVQNIPQDFPVDEQGMLQIGPLLRDHILESRKVYADVDQLRGVVADIFNEKTEEQIRKFMRVHEERLSGTESVDIPL
ncbi:hypothetical protein COU75_00240 [Candidatus Peregrinibacteria bacterium CG10_big_fil_rev_8_21_14_0_10_42_8]|nr:MAG: hypothetical protein COU75_00240 [Candidatus Peregrinibacteria bacterium CG10_big_fil_rev_8_21_14_0_10_42_8]